MNLGFAAVIDEALIFLRDRLNASLKAAAGQDGEAAAEELVTFVDGDKWGDSVSLSPGAVYALLINLEEEQILRPADQHARVTPEGTRQRVQPTIRINLYVLFVAHSKKYATSLRLLSRIVQYFQRQRVFTHTSAPELSEKIDRLVLELVTLPFAELNEIWGALRTSARPSVLYRVRMLAFEDPLPVTDPAVRDVRLELELRQ